MRHTATTLAALALFLGANLSVRAQPQLYWTNTEAGKIQRMDLPNAEMEDVVSATLQSPQDIKVDLAGGKMYWLGFGAVRRANLDGSEIETLAETKEARVLALDPESGWIYWSGDGSLQRMRLDGSSRTVLVDDTYANGLVVDHEEGKLYWTSGGCWGGVGRIFRASVLGTDVESFKSAQDCPAHLALDPGRRLLYWTLDRGLVMVARLDGSETMQAFSTHDAGFPAEHAGRWIDYIALDADEGNVYMSIEGTVYRYLDQEVERLPVESDLGFSGFSISGRDLYWTDSGEGSIKRLNLDSDAVTELITSDVLDPQQIALDPVDGKVYWAETHWIKRANLDGTDVEKLVGPVFYVGITDLALDLVSRKMYWTMWDGWGPHHEGGVYRSNLDGTDVDSLIIGGAFAIALDIDHGTMYIGDGYFDDDFKLTRANLDGSYVADLINMGSFVAVNAMALDAATETLYFHRRDGTNWNHGAIMSAQTVGSGYSNTEVCNCQPNRLGGLALDLNDRKIYWSENSVNDQEGSAEIRMANLDGSDIENVVSLSRAFLGDVVVVPSMALANASDERPAGFRLDPPYPNPFNPTTTIRYTVSLAGHVTIKVRDALGRLVATLVDDVQSAGSYSVSWIADSNTPSGTYFYTLETSEGAVTRSVVLLK